MGLAREPYKKEGTGFYNDAIGSTESLPVYKEVLESCPEIAKAIADVWGPMQASDPLPPSGNRATRSSDRNVWFMDNEVFQKTGGQGRGTPFHQDTVYVPFAGPDVAVLWISFDPILRKNGLEIVRGSHKGPLF